MSSLTSEPSRLSAQATSCDNGLRPTSTTASGELPDVVELEGSVLTPFLLGSTRPFLSLVEKRWIAFQLLTGLQHARERNVSFSALSAVKLG